MTLSGTNPFEEKKADPASDEPGTPHIDDGFITATTNVQQDTLLPEALDPESSKAGSKIVTTAIERVRHEGIFDCFTDLEINRLSLTAKIIEIPKGKELRTEQKGIYIIIEGSVQCYLIDASGAHHPLSEGKAGQIFGELSFLVERSELQEAAVYVEAKNDLKVLRLEPEIFLSSINENIKALNFLLREQVKRLSFMNQHAALAVQLDPSQESLQARTLSQRLADKFDGKVGTWRFVIGGVLSIGAYMGYNAIAKSMGLTYWDDFPFQFLNLGLSAISGFTPSIVMISQKRIAQIDRAFARVNQILLIGVKRDVDILNKRSEKMESQLADIKNLLEKQLENKDKDGTSDDVK